MQGGGLEESFAEREPQEAGTDSCMAAQRREQPVVFFFFGSDRSVRKGEAVGPPSPKSARCDASENASTEDDAPTPPSRESSSCSTLGGLFRSLFYPAGEGGGAYPARPCRPVKWACSFW